MKTLVRTLMLLGLVALALSSYTAAAQEGEASLEFAAKAIGAGLAVGLAGIGGGYAVGVAGAAAISSITEKPEMFGRSLLFVVLGEGIAIYGLLIALLLLLVV
ncbi:V-type ATP synthase subunit L [Aeropyrum pernix]|uniref:V-type ATP synthase subunit L n=1 Tax=Aeropyrum pernix TaxID=56636 RepID=A0A401H7G2_AERPX|nr:V-type ATP synthase subunit K [Aeropyrum pernix]GBF08343.1 V-type ATP synthase subunit L [Aeropyrum pernix]